MFLNGVEVVGPRDFTRSGSSYDERSITVLASNLLEVQVRGRPGTSLTITVIGTDEDPPGITTAADPPPNSNGWNNGAVTVSFDCDDAISGIATCPSPITVSAEGAGQVITGEAVDEAGNSASASVTINLDTTSPTVTPTATPAANAAGWHNQSPTISFACADGLSGVAGCPPAQLVLSEGANQTTSGTGTDLADNSAVGSVAINLDTTPPAVQITSPPSGERLDASPVTVSGTIADGLSGVVGVTCGGRPASLSSSTFTCVQPLVDGSNTISVDATDLAGNTATSQIDVTLVSDTSPPVLTITRPTAGTLVFQSRPPIELSYSDDTGVDTASLLFAVGGALREVECFPSATEARCTPVADLPDGDVTIEASVRDFVGNDASAAVSLTVDGTPLDIAITTPADRLVTTDDVITVEGIVGADASDVTVNGVVATLGVGSFSATVPLREGVNMVVAVGTKPNGKTGTTSIEVTRDVAAPVVRIDSPRDGFVSTSNVIAVTGLVNDIVNGPPTPS